MGSAYLIVLRLTFLSTLSLRRATRSYTRPYRSVLFLSTLSLRRATPTISSWCTRQPHFYPRSPCGERPSAYSTSSSIVSNFYPRSPCGERQRQIEFERYSDEISIHALLAESDLLLIWAARILPLFLSTLSLRRATLSAFMQIPGHWHFYPRSPCGERRFLTRSAAHW